MDERQLSIGDEIRVWWPATDGSSSPFDVEIVDITCSKKKTAKFKYHLKFPGDEVYKSKLTDVQWDFISEATTPRKKAMLERPLQCLSFASSHKLKMEQLRNSLQHILAPMVGGSELAFRLLCRKYGATLAYTPMINSEKFAVDEEYRREQFQTVPADRPLVVHFSANDPTVFLAAARHVEQQCDAIGWFMCSIIIHDLSVLYHLLFFFVTITS
jgi:hypothetical protein